MGFLNFQNKLCKIEIEKIEIWELEIEISVIILTIF